MSPRRSAAACTAVFAIAAACGSSHTTPLDSSTKQDGAATHDAPVTKMDASMYDFGCDDSTPCSTSMVCCTEPNQTPPFACELPANCPTADQITCDGPQDCTGTPSTPICCGIDVPDGTGQYPNCGVTSLSATCMATSACPTTLPSTCTATTKVTLCHVAGDCTESSYPDCCTFTSGSASLTFCVDAQLAAFGTCH